MKPRAECRHERLFFGSGDYYLFCSDCNAAWVCRSPADDQPAPHMANKGVGVGLSGEKRGLVRSDEWHDWTGPTKVIRHVHCLKCGKLFEVLKAKGRCEGRAAVNVPEERI